MNEAQGLKTYAIVELMGHQQLAGLVSEELVAGVPMLRVDVPAPDGEEAGFTRFYGAKSLYAITPCPEEDVRAFVEYYRPRRMPVYLPSESLLGDAAVAALPAGDEGDDGWEDLPL